MGTDSVERSIGRLEGKLDAVIKLVGDLGASFDAMEKGRLSRLEVQFATLNTEVSLKARNSAVLYASIIATVASVAATIVSHYVFHV